MQFYSLENEDNTALKGAIGIIHAVNGMDKIKTGNSSVPDNASLNGQMDYDSIFAVVKKAVRVVTGRERSGLGLALSDLPPTLGAYWQIGGNYIVINESLIREMSRISSSLTEFNSFIFMILTHEYLHSVGYVDEHQARVVTMKVVEETFGKDHPAYRMSSDDIWHLYPQLLSVKGGNGSYIRIIQKFDSESLSYFA